ncbi:MAG: serine/threonine protein kinase [Planctomycetes bacterium RBG_16_64_10]|nr:MAG: serine/threonine protein kinase [Planctomycetes bacterium RBG_16_64_10]
MTRNQPIRTAFNVLLVMLPMVSTAKDWSQWGGSPQRNNTPDGHEIPIDWNIGAFDRPTGQWQRDRARNIRWVAKLGSQTYGTPVVADGRVFVGTNNGSGRVRRYPPDVDLGCLLAFDIDTGQFLWQHSSEKLPTGQVHDWPLQGICCAPLVEGERLWFVSSRGAVVCLDVEGFHDRENDGPFRAEPAQNDDEADVIWSFDMMRELGVSQHNMCSCSVTAFGTVLFVNTSNGVDESEVNIPAPEAPSFLAMDKHTGRVLWADASPGRNILDGQWSSPSVVVVDGVPQVLFAGGDGWLYSFLGTATEDGKPQLLWRFDTNPKTSKWELGGAGTRNSIIATPVVYAGRVYVAVGQDPEHGEGNGHLWCIDPAKRGDVSPELAFRADDLTRPIPPKRLQAVVPEQGEVARPNPNSAAVWHYTQFDLNGDGEIDDFYETMHRCCGSAAIKDNLLFIADFSGLVHCVDATTGRPYWTHDMLAAAWGSPLIVEDKVYVGDEDGDVSIFRLAADPHAAMQELNGEWHPINAFRNADGNVEVPNLGNSIYSTPIVADHVLYISSRTHLFAIAMPNPKPTADHQPETRPVSSASLRQTRRSHRQRHP